MRHCLTGLLLIGNLLAQPAALASPTGQAKIDDPFPRAATAYALYLDTQNTPYWAKQENRRLPPASLTKLMTVLLVDEDDKALATDITIRQKASQESGTRLGLRQGERYRATDLLAAALIGSHNDACLALAEQLGGNEARFVEHMNRRAKQLGLQDTHFANACGHDAAGHYTTATDLARLARAVLSRPRLRELARLQEFRMNSLDGARHHLIKNTNLLLGRFPGAQGLKTGYTPQAGKCLIAYATRGLRQVLLVMLNAPNRWWDAEDLLELAFAQPAP